MLWYSRLHTGTSPGTHVCSTGCYGLVMVEWWLLVVSGKVKYLNWSL